MKLAVVVHRIGPYHFARFRAAAAHGEVVAVEASEEDDTYAWEKVGTGGAFGRVTLFRGVDSVRMPRRERWLRTREALDSLSPDAVAVTGWSTVEALASLDWCLDRRVPSVVLSASKRSDMARSRWKEALKRVIVSSFRAGYGGGTPQADYLSDLGIPRERILTGYDAVDNDHFREGAARARGEEEALRRSLGLPKPFFLASCRFVEVKNLPALLSAYASYREAAGPAAWDLVLLGSGPLLGQVEELRARLGIGSALHLPGFVQYGGLPAYYGLAGAFVLPSRNETWGLVVNEAMASSLPVIVSGTCGCAPDLVVPGETGYLCDPARPETLAGRFAAVASLPEAERRRMGARAAERVEAFSLERLGRSFWLAAAAAKEAPPPGARRLRRLVVKVAAAVALPGGQGTP